MRNFWLVVSFAFTATVAAGQDRRYRTGLEYPDDWREHGEFDTMISATADLPVKWDWRDYHLQPIKNQGSCGSCWAFSVTAVAESLHALLHPETSPFMDLAEQTLVSTCEHGGDCGGGYFAAFDYIRDRGLPDEMQDPYRARNSSCKAGLVSKLKLTRWAYIGSRLSSPSTAQIKQAVYDHGPVSVDVNGSWPSSRNVVTSCGSTGTNHMVTIEGWVDDPAYARYGGGYWIVRNSWGTNWGDGGYIRLVYKSSSGRRCYGIGGVAAYAVLEGVENIREAIGL